MRRFETIVAFFIFPFIKSPLEVGVEIGTIIASIVNEIINKQLLMSSIQNIL